MNNKEINSMIESLNASMWAFENYMVENDGVCDEASDQMEEQIGILKNLLTTEGIDSLGRWLKAKEDEIKSLKAEKDYITRKINAATGTIDYIKTQMNKILTAAQMEEIKGANGYKFQVTTSTKTEVDKDVLKTIYADRIEEAIRAAHIPAYVGVTLTASSTKAAEFGIVEGDEEIFHTTEKPSVRFTKPRASKEA
jgi:uncharacterized coiled-coil DUF342 family protein